MAKLAQTQQIIKTFAQETYLLSWVEAFLIDRQAQNLTPGSIRFYRQKLEAFAKYCEAQALTQVDEITPNFLRQYLLYLGERGNNSGGIHAVYRTLRAFLLWYESEAEPENWKNPIRKVKGPKVDIEPLEPADLDAISKMVDTCEKGTFAGERDRALMLFLLDTGTRAGECLGVNLEDVNPITGAVMIRKSKSRKPRSVYLGAKARKAIRAYLKQRRDNHPALFVTDEGKRPGYDGLRGIITRRAALAKVKAPSLHSFRRAFALAFLRNGGDIYTLQKLMGHADLQVLRRYLAQTDADLQAGHAKSGPVDHSNL